jgi:hypothetical protein
MRLARPGQLPAPATGDDSLIVLNQAIDDLARLRTAYRLAECPNLAMRDTFGFVPQAERCNLDKDHRHNADVSVLGGSGSSRVQRPDGHRSNNLWLSADYANLEYAFKIEYLQGFAAPQEILILQKADSPPMCQIHICPRSSPKFVLDYKGLYS